MKIIDHNFLPEQYEVTNELPINHNYLQQQFRDSEKIFEDIKELVMKGDFTLGNAVNELEEEFKKVTSSKFAIGVGSAIVYANGAIENRNIAKQRLTTFALEAL